MAVLLKLKFRQVEAISEVLEAVAHSHPETRDQKVLVSAMEEISTKFARKVLSLRYKYKPEALYQMSLKEYEAAFLEEYLRSSLRHLDMGYNRVVANNIADIINQKLA